MGCRVGTSWARALGLAALIGIAASADASCGNGESASLSSGTWSRYCCSPSEVTNVDFYVSGGSGSDDNIEFRIGRFRRRTTRRRRNFRVSCIDIEESSDSIGINSSALR